MKQAIFIAAPDMLGSFIPSELVIHLLAWFLVNSGLVGDLLDGMLVPVESFRKKRKIVHVAWGSDQTFSMAL